jgi:nucleotide-binding universal stress UspA family protein
MSIFPTNILVATDDTESAVSAVRAAAELSAKTDSGIELVYVGKEISTPAAYDDPSSRDTVAARKARELLDGVK